MAAELAESHDALTKRVAAMGSGPDLPPGLSFTALAENVAILGKASDQLASRIGDVEQKVAAQGVSMAAVGHTLPDMQSEVTALKMHVSEIVGKIAADGAVAAAAAAATASGTHGALPVIDPWAGAAFGQALQRVSTAVGGFTTRSGC